MKGHYNTVCGYKKLISHISSAMEQHKWHNCVMMAWNIYFKDTGFYIPFFLDEKLWYEIFGLIRNVSKFLIFKIPVTGQDIVEGFIVIITQKRRQSSEAEVKRNMFSLPVFPSSCTWSPVCQVRLFCHSGLSYKRLLSKKVSRPFPFSHLFTCLNKHPSSLTLQELLSFMVGYIF